MKLVIDSEDALRSDIGPAFRAPLNFADGVVIKLDLKVQENTNWCWASIACALGRYYETSDLSQSEMVQQVLGLNSNTDNVPTRLDSALSHSGCYSHWSPGKPALDRLQYEINQGRPVAARIAWHDGNAHYALIHGYAHDNDAVYVADPMYGNSVQSLQDFPNKYQQKGAWTESFWTSPGDKISYSERVSNGRL